MWWGFYSQTEPKQSPSELSLLLSLVKVKCVTSLHGANLLNVLQV